jgi:hypothetical protein
MIEDLLKRIDDSVETDITLLNNNMLTEQDIRNIYAIGYGMYLYGILAQQSDVHDGLDAWLQDMNR